MHNGRQSHPTKAPRWWCEHKGQLVAAVITAAKRTAEIQREPRVTNGGPNERRRLVDPIERRSREDQPIKQRLCRLRQGSDEWAKQQPSSMKSFSIDFYSYYDDGSWRCCCCCCTGGSGNVDNANTINSSMVMARRHRRHQSRTYMYIGSRRIKPAFWAGTLPVRDGLSSVGAIIVA